jgi:hypothetical protein
MSKKPKERFLIQVRNEYAFLFLHRWIYILVAVLVLVLVMSWLTNR